MITQKDQEIINHALNYGLTVRQCAKIFYTDRYPMVSAQKRLKILHDRDILQRFKVWETNEYVYGKECSRHQIYRMDFYSELFKIATITDFKPEYSICGVRPDAYIRFKLNGDRILFLEVDLNNKTNMKKYDDLYTYHNQEVRKTLGTFPQIVIMSHYKPKYSGQLKISHVDLQLSSLKNIFVS